MDANLSDRLDEDGYALVRRVYSDGDIQGIRNRLTVALKSSGDSSQSIRSRAGTVYAARNILSVFHDAEEIWQRPPLPSILCDILGDDFGLVRGLYFDKPPERSWSLPWHKDLTIAVRQNDLPTTQFKNPTKKSGVAHVEAPQSILESMVTLRIHLDPVTEENGPLVVMPGSHKNGKKSAGSASGTKRILANQGDVLVMRPLLSHSSGNATPGTTKHRRILHLEFSGQRELPDNYRWHNFRSP